MPEARGRKVTVATVKTDRNAEIVKEEDYFKDPLRPPPPVDGALNTSFVFRRRESGPSKREIATAGKTCRKLGKEISKLQKKSAVLSMAAGILRDDVRAEDLRLQTESEERFPEHLVIGGLQVVTSALWLASWIAQGHLPHLVFGAIWALSATLTLSDPGRKQHHLTPAEKCADRVMDGIFKRAGCALDEELRIVEAKRLDEKEKVIEAHIAQHQKELKSLGRIVNAEKGPMDTLSP